MTRGLASLPAAVRSLLFGSAAFATTLLFFADQADRIAN